MIDASDFFRGRIDQMIDLRHPLAVLASRMPWQEIEASLDSQFARRVREGKRVEGMDLFGPSTQLMGAGVSKAGRPRLAMRLMISLLYLKHAFNESDEAVVERWGETPIWQFFSGMDYYEHRRACDPTALV
ncbi:MAG: transposase, partial [Burkholderiales bacterium]|nr:transposase [Burkholderiales bacterium]